MSNTSYVCVRACSDSVRRPLRRTLLANKPMSRVHASEHRLREIHEAAEQYIWTPVVDETAKFAKHAS